MGVAEGGVGDGDGVLLAQCPGEAFRAELEAFIDVVAGTRTSPCTVDDALAVAYIAEAATLSLKQHRPVQIDEVRAS